MVYIHTCMYSQTHIKVNRPIKKKKEEEEGKEKDQDQKMAHWVKALVTKPDNLGLIPWTHIVGENQCP